MIKQLGELLEKLLEPRLVLPLTGADKAQFQLAHATWSEWARDAESPEEILQALAPAAPEDCELIWMHREPPPGTFIWGMGLWYNCAEDPCLGSLVCRRRCG